VSGAFASGLSAVTLLITAATRRYIQAEVPGVSFFTDGTTGDQGHSPRKRRRLPPTLGGLSLVP